MALVYPCSGDSLATLCAHSVPGDDTCNLAAMDVDILAVQVVDRAEASVGNLQQERNLPVSLIHRGKLSCDHPDA